MDTLGDNKGAAVPATYGYSEFHPRFWHGMTLGPWVRLIRGNLRKIAIRRYPLTISITLAAFVNSFLATLARLFYSRRIAQTEFENEPVFILGYWRAGTTWLQELLICDERHSCPKAIQCFMPQTFLLTHKLSGLFDRVLPAKRPMDRVEFAMDRPQEDEVAMLISGFQTPYRYMAFPSSLAAEGVQPGFWPQSEAESNNWVSGWLWFLRCIQYANSGKRLVLKSPPHTARIGMILEQFPNARFIHISRDPQSLFASNMKMTKAMVATQSLEVDCQSNTDIASGVIEMHNRIYEAFFRDVEQLSEGQISFLRYEDLRADTESALRKIYRHLDLGDIEPALPKLRELIQTKNDYVPDEYHLTLEQTSMVDKAWEEYSSRFGYALAADAKGNAQNSVTLKI